MFFEDFFSLKKIREDFFFWIKDEHPNLNHIEVEELTSHDVKVISISKDDILTPYQYKALYDIKDGVYYELNIAIGQFKEMDQYGFMEIEKGIVKLYYNSDLSLYKGELFYDKMHEKQ